MSLTRFLATIPLRPQFAFQNKHRFHETSRQITITGCSKQLPGIKLLEKCLALCGYIGGGAGLDGDLLSSPDNPRRRHFRSRDPSTPSLHLQAALSARIALPCGLIRNLKME